MLHRPNSSERSYSFGPFRVDISDRQLYKDGQPVELPRRLWRTLQLLVENHGKDLDKTYLMQQLWPDTVVEEHNLTVIISMLRKVLGDDPEHKKYILTRPGWGYRFVAEVTETDLSREEQTAPVPSPSGPAAGVANPPAAQQRGFSHWHRSRLLAGLASGLVLVLALLGLSKWHQRMLTQSIAVLPFQAVGTEHDDGYLGLGMADGLIARLRNIRHLVVRSTADVSKYQAVTGDPIAFGNELHVLSIIDGTVQRRGDQIWLRVKLRRVKDGAVLWTNDYHGRFADVLALQDQIAEEATRALSLRLDTAEQRSIHRHYTASSDAYQNYIGGQWYCSPRSSARLLEKGLMYFQQAIAKDRNFALAYSGLAACYVQLASLEVSPRPELFPKAEQAAQHALELDANLSDAYLPLALSKLYFDWDFPAAEAAFRSSIRLAPEVSATHQSFALFLVSQGRFREAEGAAHKALELDPFSWTANMVLNDIYFYAHRYKEALEGWEKGREVDIGESVWYLAWMYAAQGRPTRLTDELAKAAAAAPRKGLFIAELAYVAALAGMRSEAEGYLQQLSEDPGIGDYEYERSLIYAALGDRDRAFNALALARDKRSLSIIFLNVDPRLESLRSDPRFAELLRSTHLSF